MNNRSIFIIAGLATGSLSLAMTTWQYIGVLSQGQGSTHSVIIYFNRHGELYWDGLALIGLLSIVSLALIFYLKECKIDLQLETKK